MSLWVLGLLEREPEVILDGKTIGWSFLENTDKSRNLKMQVNLSQEIPATL